MSTDTSEYTDRQERKLAKKVTRHPLYQKMRRRALVAEAHIDKLRKQLAERTAAHDKDSAAMTGTVTRWQDDPALLSKALEEIELRKQELEQLQAKLAGDE